MSHIALPPAVFDRPIYTIATSEFISRINKELSMPKKHSQCYLPMPLSQRPELRSGDRCVIFTLDPMGAANNGAFVTLEQPDPKDESQWYFKDASRPLIMVPDDGNDVCDWVVKSNPCGPEADYYTIGENDVWPLRDQHDEANERYRNQ